MNTIVRIRRPAGALLTLVLLATVVAGARAQEIVASPDGMNRATVMVRDGGLFYRVDRSGEPVILPSRLGFEFRGMPALSENLSISGTARDSHDETWTQPWGEQETVRNHYNELRVSVVEGSAPNRRFDVVFRAFDDGVAFRYEMPGQPGIGAFEMTRELTEFTLADDGRAWWIPAGLWNRYEFIYSASPISRLPLVHTPLTIEMQSGLHVVLHEANLVDYAAMNLQGSDSRTLRASLAPWADSVLVRGAAPFVSPWRTIEVADRAVDLEPATMALNLNPPSVLENTDWIEPSYVGDLTAEGHAHHGQYMVRHWRHVLEKAAEHHIMMNVHEPIKDTGERRTYPNMVSREGARGQEYNAWGGEGGNPPEHETILFFTRMHAGPIDFTPGVFDVLLESAGPARTPSEPRPRTTVAKQLAIYVVLYSPLQMAADLPENYEGNPAFRFIRDVALDWEQTRVLEGRIGDHVVVARQERDGPEWFIGAITDEEGRSFDVDLSFLEPGRSYVAEIYADGADAHWRTNPLPVDISERRVDAGTTLTLELAPGGGQAIRIRPAQ